MTSLAVSAGVRYSMDTPSSVELLTTRTCIIAGKSVMMWSVAGKMPVRKILGFVEKSSTDNVGIMTTGRIEVGPSGRTVAANVKRLREARGLTLRALSSTLKEQGRSLSADALNKIENGASAEPRAVRRVDVDDLVALALALGVNPSALLLPFTDDPAEVIEVTGAGEVSAEQAWDWADGEMPLGRITPGDPEGNLLRWALYARPAGRRQQFAPGGD